MEDLQEEKVHPRRNQMRTTQKRQTRWRLERLEKEKPFFWVPIPLDLPHIFWHLPIRDCYAIRLILWAHKLDVGGTTLPSMCLMCFSTGLLSDAALHETFLALLKSGKKTWIELPTDGSDGGGPTLPWRSPRWVLPWALAQQYHVNSCTSHHNL